MASLQELSATLRERQACRGIEDMLADERRSLRHELAGARGAVMLAESASAGPSAPILTAGLERLECGLNDLAEQVNDMRKRLNSEVQSLRRAMSGIAEVVHAMKPVLDADSEQRADIEGQRVRRLESGFAGLREEVREFSGLFPLQEQRVDLCDLVNMKAKLRLLALERDSGELRRQLERDSGELRRQEQALNAKLVSIESLTTEANAWAETAICEAREANREAVSEAVDGTIRLGASLRDTEKKLAAEAQTGFVVAKVAEKAAADSEASTQAAHKRVADIEHTLQTGIVKLHTEIRDAVKAHSDDFGAKLAVGIKTAEAYVADVETRCAEVSDEQRIELDRSLGEVGSATRIALSRAMRGLSSEVTAERKHRLANEADILSRLSRSEQSVASETHDQGLCLQSLKDCLSAHAEKHQREERAIWAKLHDVSETVGEKFSAEQRSALVTEVDVHARGLRHEIHQELSKQIDEQIQRAVGDAKDHVQDVEVKSQRVLSILDSRTTELSNLVEEQIRRALGSMDCRYERCVEQLLIVQQRHESAAAVSNERRLEGVVREARSALAESEAKCGDVQRCSRQDVEAIRSELRAFMDEQRVFCGFLDTEQRSFQDLMRQEITALSRLVDSVLHASTA